MFVTSCLSILAMLLTLIKTSATPSSRSLVQPLLSVSYSALQQSLQVPTFLMSNILFSYVMLLPKTLITLYRDSDVLAVRCQRVSRHIRFYTCYSILIIESVMYPLILTTNRQYLVLVQIIIQSLIIYRVIQQYEYQLDQIDYVTQRHQVISLIAIVTV